MEASAWTQWAAGRLGELLTEPLVVVDVGCRWGFADAWTAYGSAATVIGFDPDAEECARLREHHAGDPGVRVVDRALGAHAGPATLHLTREAGCSSLYPPDEELIARYPAMDLHTPVGTTTVDLTTLDEWCAGASVGRVDALKLDVQGAELDVLRGATRVLPSVRALQVEVQLHPMYRGAPRFTAVDEHLTDAGFVLWRLERLAHQTARGAHSRVGIGAQFTDRAPSFFESRPGRVFFAEAIYVRPEMAAPAAGTDFAARVRDAGVANGFELHDLAAVALESARDGADPAAVGTIDILLAGLGPPTGPPADASGTPRAGAPGTVGADVLDGEWTVRMDVPFAGAGWHAPQLLPYGAARWTGPGTDAWLELPGVVRDGSAVEVLVVASLIDDVASSVVVELDGVPLEVSPVPHEHGVALRGSAPEGRRMGRVSVLRIHTPAPQPWPDGSDPTLRGVAIGGVTGGERSETH